MGPALPSSHLPRTPGVHSPAAQMQRLRVIPSLSFVSRLTTSRIKSMLRHLVLLCLPSSLPLAAQSQTSSTRSAAAKVAGAVDHRVLRSDLEFLADDALEGRRPGTRGGELAAKYVAAQFERLGLEPAGDSGTYYHRVRIITLTPNPTLRISDPKPGDLVYGKDYVLWSMRNEPVTETQGDLVFVGYGIVAPEYQW